MKSDLESPLYHPRPEERGVLINKGGCPRVLTTPATHPGMSPSTSSAPALRSDSPTSSEQQLPHSSPRHTVRRRSIAHDSLLSLASSMSGDASNDNSLRRKSCNDVAPFKLPSVSLPFLRSADKDCGASQTFKLPSVSLPFLRSTKCDASPAPADCWECLNDTTVHTPRVYRKSPYQRQQSNPIEQVLSKPSEDEDAMIKWLLRQTRRQGGSRTTGLPHDAVCAPYLGVLGGASHVD